MPYSRKSNLVVVNNICTGGKFSWVWNINTTMFKYVIDVGSRILITLVDRAIPCEVTTVFFPFACFLLCHRTFARLLKARNGEHLTYLTCTSQTWKSRSSFVFTYAPRDPIPCFWYVPRCKRKNASLRNAATTSWSTIASTFWRCLFGVLLEWWTIRAQLAEYLKDLNLWRQACSLPWLTYV